MPQLPPRKAGTRSFGYWDATDQFVDGDPFDFTSTYFSYAQDLSNQEKLSQFMEETGLKATDIVDLLMELEN